MADIKPEHKERLKEIIHRLHEGADAEELRGEFAELLQDVGPTQISELESELIEEGLPEREIRRLCDVHLSLFQTSLEALPKEEVPKGHPVDLLRRENEAILQAIEEARTLLEGLSDEAPEKKWEEMKGLLEDVGEVEKHYLRQENELFSFLERNGVEGPPKVLWTLHDDARDLLKEVKEAVQGRHLQETVDKGRRLLNLVEDTAYKEENILFPMSLEVLGDEDWLKIKRGGREVGYALIAPENYWLPEIPVESPQAEASKGEAKALTLDMGALTLEQVNLLLKHAPVDMTFVDEDDEVRFYSEGPDRIFPRTPGIIGRKVQNCHPPDSVDVVEEILNEFKAGKRNEAEFWLTLEGRFIHIRYFAVRDENGEYRGVLEVTQDVTEIRELEGERQLLDWE